MPERVVLTLTEVLPRLFVEEPLPRLTLAEDDVSFTLQEAHSPHLSLMEDLPILTLVEDFSPEAGAYLSVTPEVQWITDDVGAIFRVISNAEWEIV
jgi:hypothetical protein